MKLWLDDMRSAPDLWHRVWTAPQAIECLSKRLYTEASFDHDLGACKQCLADYDGEGIPSDCEHNGNGYQVLCWLEEQVVTDPTFPIPTLHVHTDNASARPKMLQAIASIERIEQRRVTLSTIGLTPKHETPKKRMLSPEDLEREIRECADAWDPSACLIGNVTAGELREFVACHRSMKRERDDARRLCAEIMLGEGNVPLEPQWLVDEYARCEREDEDLRNFQDTFGKV